ncbi:MAG: integrase core domain-containing protein, partial [Planctomycetes bacterium]|nr:integrase core domain-containing protein [Planctomycetota bacterium]
LEALEMGIASYGAPREVLTDQGRQYASWRGKSAFQKLCAKRGIAHFTSKAQHPETLGKCERLWRTVKEELFDRVLVETVEEARRRLEHYFRHYNFFRPHQGLDGAVPADRFFGAEEEVRRALGEIQAENELRLALGEPPRRPLFLAGQIDGQPVSISGEKGHVDIQLGEVMKRLQTGTLGGPEAREEDHDGGGGDGAKAAQDGPEEAAGWLRDARAAGGGGAGAVGGGERGGEEPGARGGDGDPRVVAGGDAEGGGAGAPAGEAAAAVADEPDGALGDGGGAAQAAGHGAGAAAPGGGGPGGAAEEDRASGAGAVQDAGDGVPAPGDAGLEGAHGWAPESDGGNGASSEGPRSGRA